MKQNKQKLLSHSKVVRFYINNGHSLVLEVRNK